MCIKYSFNCLIINPFIYYCSNVIKARAMYVASAHKGCGNDRLWMVLIQNQDGVVCQWERIRSSNLPRLLYASGQTEAHERNRK